MRFEKWQALGNDYIIVERQELTTDEIRALCARHTGVGADGVLVLLDPDERGFVARVRIFNPDGSEAELSGNGVRQAILYLRHRGWTAADTFSVQTIAGGRITRWSDYSNMDTLVSAAPQWWLEHVMAAWAEAPPAQP